ncbi:MAG: AraC family transcriptional regulator ligand-binding domain-containing protein [Alphaproteobacteria bacterium]|nr:AraC family transcriptional regulator ligand-binding domain-containing protein [Alphaproteobacteria bacterium]
MKSSPQGEVPLTPFLWTRGIAAREVLHHLDRNGFDAEPLLAKAELSRSQVMQGPGGISFASQHRFLELAAVNANDSLLGLHAAAEMDLRDAGILFYLAASSPTVAEALDHLVRYAGAESEAVHLDVARHKDETILTARPVLAFDEPGRQFSEFTALALVRILRRATNRDFAPRRITFAHVRNCSLRELHGILRCPAEFAQIADSWVLPQSVMALPIISSDSRLLHILEAHAEDLLSERRSAAGLTGLVENQLLGMLPTGRVQLAVVARQLGMSTRSFTRRLAQEGSSFGEILDGLRHRLALHYLEDRRNSLQQIAWLLGYSEVGAFNHAFKRWTGTSPGRARNLPT